MLFDKEYRALVDDVKTLLGGTFTEIEVRHERARASRTRPAGPPHRLMMVLDDLEASMASSKTDQPYLQIQAFAELLALVQLLREYQEDERWPDLQRKLIDPRQYAHTLLLLVLADGFKRMMPQVNMVIEPDSEGRRAPDLILSRDHPDPRQQLALELKSPVNMQTPYPALSKTSAESLVAKWVKRATLRSGGQLLPPRPGILVFGGFHPWPDDMQLLEEAARKHLQRRPPPPHIMGVALLWLIGGGTGIEVTDNRVYGTSRSGVFWARRFQMVQNDYYDGEATLLLEDTPMAPLPTPKLERDGLYDRNPLRFLP